MSYRIQRRYCGPLQAVIADWAGTTVDFGCLAPVMAFQEAFDRAGVPVSPEEARGPMGKDKRTHVEEVLFHPAVAARWAQAKGAAPTQSEVDAIYADYVPRQLETIRRRATLVPGWLGVVAELRGRGIRLGANTGYNRAMSEALLSAARAAGYAPDSAVCSDDVPRGRPYPAMALLNAAQLDVRDVAACVKVDDTVPGIEEGLAAGMWTVGVAISGNAVGLDAHEWAALPAAGQARRREHAARELAAAAPHFIIDSVADLIPVIDELTVLLRRGARP